MGAPHCPVCPAEDDFHALLDEQNKAMDTLGLQVRTLRYLPDNQTYVGIINTVREVSCCRSTCAACKVCLLPFVVAAAVAKTSGAS
jgi:ribosomal protein L30/L7E